jgi:hypothetical protein
MNEGPNKEVLKKGEAEVAAKTQREHVWTSAYPVK